jgi:hypothetical protein
VAVTRQVAARAQQIFHYPLDDIYSTAVRFVRIDRGCPILDRDPQAAYLVFECREDKRMQSGTLEMFRTPDGVRVQVTLKEAPSYVEARFLEGLAHKLRDERGLPARPKAPPPDGGAAR